MRFRFPAVSGLLAAAALVVAAALALAACGQGSPTAGPPPTPPGGENPPAAGPAPALHVQGASLVDASGKSVRLRGVNRSGAEYACVQGRGIFDGPVDSASITAIRSWHVNAVRIPMNESCWLGINGVKPDYSGGAYQKAIADLVAELNRQGMVAILDLHWAAPGAQVDTGQKPMPNRDHTPEFWRQVAKAYGTNGAVLFDLFNEPYPDNNSDTPEAWRCWRDGGTCRGMSYQAAGMQELVDAVRGAGATNVILLGGVQYSAGLSGWLANKPTDPLHNLAASWHVYNFSWCHDRACWDASAAPVSAQVPLVLGELGEDDGGTTFVNSLMDWMDARQGSYLAWVWNVWHGPLDLIQDYGGTPTAYGQTFRTRFAAPAS